MIIQVNTDNHITGSDELSGIVQSIVEGALAHVSEQITRVEVHISDENGPKGGEADIRCAIEARLKGRQPTAVSHRAAEVTEAVDGAAEKLKKALESDLGRLDRR